MAIERRQRLHHFEVMLHNTGKPGGSYYVESYDWDTDANAIVPGTGMIGNAQAIGVNAGDTGLAWSKVREMLDVQAVEVLNQAVATVETATAERDTALADKQQAEAEAAKHEQAREKMREAMEGKLADLQRALAEEETAKVNLADVVVKGT